MRRSVHIGSPGDAAEKHLVREQRHVVNFGGLRPGPNTTFVTAVVRFWPKADVEHMKYSVALSRKCCISVEEQDQAFNRSRR